MKHEMTNEITAEGRDESKVPGACFCAALLGDTVPKKNDLCSLPQQILQFSNDVFTHFL